MENTRGLLMVHTGNGKGKTTAAIGLGLRAWGQGLRVLILQFIKGNWKYGELQAIGSLGDRFVIRQMGEGFVNRAGDEQNREEHEQAAQETLREARQALQSGRWDLLVLDEANYAVKFGLISAAELLALIEEKPPAMHLLLTGRDALPEVIAKADLVTEMREIKHPYQQGIAAQRGIEF